MTSLRIRHGQVYGDEYRKAVSGSKHQLKKPPAWALDVTDLMAAGALEATVVRIRDTETGTNWWATIETILDKGFRFNRGHGQQIALALKHWEWSKWLALKKNEPAATTGKLWEDAV